MYLRLPKSDLNNVLKKGNETIKAEILTDVTKNSQKKNLNEC